MSLLYSKRPVPSSARSTGTLYSVQVPLMAVYPRPSQVLASQVPASWWRGTYSTGGVHLQLLPHPHRASMLRLQIKQGHTQNPSISLLLPLAVSPQAFQLHSHSTRYQPKLHPLSPMTAGDPFTGADTRLLELVWPPPAAIQEISIRQRHRESCCNPARLFGLGMA